MGGVTPGAAAGTWTREGWGTHVEQGKQEKEGKERVEQGKEGKEGKERVGHGKQGKQGKEGNDGREGMHAA